MKALKGYIVDKHEYETLHPDGYGGDNIEYTTKLQIQEPSGELEWYTLNNCQYGLNNKNTLQHIFNCVNKGDFIVAVVKNTRNENKIECFRISNDGAIFYKQQGPIFRIIIYILFMVGGFGIINIQLGIAVGFIVTILMLRRWLHTDRANKLLMK